MTNLHKTIRRSGNGSSTSTRFKTGNTTTTITTNSKGKTTTTRSARAGNTTYSNSYSFGGKSNATPKNNALKNTTIRKTLFNHTNKNYKNQSQNRSKSYPNNFRATNNDSILGSVALKGIALLAAIYYGFIILLIALYISLLFINSPGIAAILILNAILNTEISITLSWVVSISISAAIFILMHFFIKSRNFKFYLTYVIYLSICAAITYTALSKESVNKNISIKNTLINEWSYGKFEGLKGLITPKKHK